MDISTIKALLDACYQAKRVRELLPALPNGVSSSHIQYLDIIEQLENRGMKVKISDISDTLHLPRPGVTRTVKEMEDKGFLKKTTSDADGRITYLSITEAGKKLSQTYNDRFFSQLAPLLTDISMVVPKAILAGEIEAVIEKCGGAHLESYQLFDIYEGSQIKRGFKSLAYSIVFRSKEKTLEESEITSAMNKILKALEGMGIELRQ